MGNTNGSLTQDMIYVQQLMVIDGAEKSDCLNRYWNEFKKAIDPNTASGKKMRTEILGDSTGDFATQVDKYINNWISPGANDLATATKLAAIRLLGRAGGDQGQREVVFNKLWGLIKDGNQRADIRAWALYSLHHCDLTITQDRWHETFGQPVNDKEKSWLQSIDESDVRHWAFYAVAEMARYSRYVRCWNDGDDCGRDDPYLRLDDNQQLFESVEKLILDHWPCEIDVDVRAQMVNALGWITGWSTLPITLEQKWQVEDYLDEAAKSEYTRLASPVPTAIRRIAANVMHNKNVKPDHRLVVVQRLVHLAIERLIHCEDRAKEADKEDVDRYGDLYNQQREYLLAVRDIARTGLRDVPIVASEREAKDVVEKCIEALLDVADSQLSSVSVSIRQLALLFLNDLAKGDEQKESIRIADSAVPSAVEIEKVIAIARYKTMLGDSEPEIVNSVVENLTLLMGGRGSSEFFVDLILNRDPKVAATIIDHEAKTKKLTGEDLENLAKRIRRVAAQALATIPENNTAHDTLVETLRGSDIVTSGWAREALTTMGGQKAVDAIVQDSLQRMVQEKYFAPMEEARAEGWKLLKQVRSWSQSNYRYAYAAALGSFGVGIVLLVFGIFQLSDPASTDVELSWIFGSGALATLAGIVGTFLWEPAKGVQKVSSELTQLLMSFENYLGRMRLIGLAFAHAYSGDNWAHLDFLKGISNLSGNALRDSAKAVKEIGDWPGYKMDPYSIGSYAITPSLMDVPIDEAYRLVENAGLKLERGEPQYRENCPTDIIVAQHPEPGVLVAKDFVVKVSLSTSQAALRLAVPQFTGKSITEALRLAQENKLVIADVFFGSNGQVEEVVVTKQNIPQGIEVKEGSPMVLTVDKKFGAHSNSNIALLQNLDCDTGANLSSESEQTKDKDGNQPSKEKA